MSLLTLEPMLMAQLTEQVPGAHVGRMRDIADLERERIPVPALMVGYRSGSVVEVGHSGREAEIRSNWGVVAVVRNPGNDGDADVSDELSPLVDGALAALMGWYPSQILREPLRLASLPEAGFGSGYVWLPLIFESVSRIKQPV